MKLGTLIIAFLSAIVFANAQKQEAHIIYDITMESDDPQVQAQLGMLAGSSLEMAFKDDLSKQVFSMGALMTTTTVSDRSSGKGMMLMSGMMGKYGAFMDVEEMMEDQDDMDVEIELVDETKEVMGYNCKKAIVIDEEGNETIFWYTDEITMPKTDGRFFKKGIPGVPLKFSVDNPQMTMVMTAKEVNKKVKKPKKVFALAIPEGYTEKTFEELQQLMNPGQGE